MSLRKLVTNSYIKNLYIRNIPVRYNSYKKNKKHNYSRNFNKTTDWEYVVGRFIVYSSCGYLLCCAMIPILYYPMMNIAHVITPNKCITKNKNDTDNSYVPTE